ncbi:hypothetical protein QT234_07210 [Geobacillus stearothermophilus]|nr:hypothetical protein QT234_07210 [Geobacillus stearothermophilus]WJQ04983.1 hypothetical protein QT236_07015 [Geobacillus stearothermophilus]WJQ08525.1 hypothetical protein QT235_08125 [Geobacillus stearothermophilus]WJQ11962.1 hypothetical protein QT237_07620 [Geobacillus stearothermophilus]WJQ12590.1 hypothetical protein QT238_10300 [Geobacillus stearothermophilus]
MFIAAPPGNAITNRPSFSLFLFKSVNHLTVQMLSYEPEKDNPYCTRPFLQTHAPFRRTRSGMLSGRIILPAVHVPLLAKRQEGWLTAEKQHARRKSEQQ